MASNFSTTLSSLRKERGWSQRKVATDLSISQALLSHYENGLREPRLEFVVKACDYYGVTADYILGRVAVPDAARQLADDLRDVFSQLESLSGEVSVILEGAHK